MRRALVGTALTAAALLTAIQPANAATRPASAPPASLGAPVTSTDINAFATWIGDPSSNGSGSKQKIWQVQFDVSSLPDANVLNVSSCIDYVNSNGQLTKETCTTGQATRFTYTLNVSDLTRASVSASSIPAQTCSTDGNFQPIGPCKPAAPMNVKASWTGQGPITYSTFTQYIPGIYRLVQRTKDRNAVVSGAVNGKSPTGQSFGSLQSSTTKQWGSPCGIFGAQHGLTHMISIHPDGC